MKNGAKKLLIMAFCVILALFSIFGASKWASAPENHRETIQYLDDRRTAVLELAGASTAASIAITVSPGDIGTPIANKLADLSSYFLLIVSALVLEKYLVTITGYVAFTYLIPIACLLLILAVQFWDRTFTRAAAKVAAFGVAIVLLVPLSVRLSRMIEATYQDVHQAIAFAEEVEEGELLTEITEPEQSAQGAAEQSAAGTAGEEEADRAWWQKFSDGITGRMNNAAGVAQDTLNQIREDLNGIVNQVTVAPEKLKELLNHFIEAVAVLIVTSCVIPILVLLSLFWLIKLFFGVDVPLPPRHFGKRMFRNRENDGEKQE